MKKLVLLAAFAGLLASSAVANTKGDDKDKKAKKECKSGEKACAGEKKAGCTAGEKSCCKKKAEASATAATGEKATEKK